MDIQDFELTPEQIKACDRIKRAIDTARNAGVKILAKSDCLQGYQLKAWELGLMEPEGIGGGGEGEFYHGHRICSIDGAGADDAEKFKPGVFNP